MKSINEVNIHTRKLDVDYDHIPEEAFLPTVTEEDTGKVLMVSSDGIWETKEFSGGSATPPYLEEVYDSEGNLIDVRLVGYTFVRDFLFAQCPNLALTSLPSGLTSIGEATFAGCTSLSLTSLPSGITSIGEAAFADCPNLALTSLPSGLTSIGEAAFQNCSSLALTSLPSGITSIGKFAFYHCLRLTSITFEGTPTTIDSKAFNGCTNLTTINVPWAEGAVANAPWGATNATINYNYTE